MTKIPYTVFAATAVQDTTETIICRFFASNGPEALMLVDRLLSSYDVKTVMLGHSAFVDETTVVENQDYFFNFCQREVERYKSMISNDSLSSPHRELLERFLPQLEKYVSEMKDYQA